MAPFNFPVTEKVSKVAKDGEDAIAHVGEYRHQHGRLFERLTKGTVVQAAMMRCCVDLCKMKGAKVIPLYFLGEIKVKPFNLSFKNK